MTKVTIPLKEIESLISNVWEWEVRHYFEDGCSKGHCFSDVIAVAKWLSTVPDADYDWKAQLEDLKNLKKEMT